MLGEFEVTGGVEPALPVAPKPEPPSHSDNFRREVKPQQKPVDLGYVSDSWLRDHTWRAGRSAA